MNIANFNASLFIGYLRVRLISTKSKDKVGYVMVFTTMVSIGDESNLTKSSFIQKMIRGQSQSWTCNNYNSFMGLS